MGRACRGHTHSVFQRQSQHNLEFEVFAENAMGAEQSGVVLSLCQKKKAHSMKDLVL